MNWVDSVVLCVLLASALLAFIRGFVRLTLGLAAWIAAVGGAIWTYPFSAPGVRRWIPDVSIADPVALVLVFVIILITLSTISGWIANRVRGSSAGSLDRTLGLLFGVCRGAALVIAAYIFAQRLVPVEHWPAPILHARFLPLAYRGASWAVAKLPRELRPQLEAPRLAGRVSAADLLRTNPQGYAVSAGAGAPKLARNQPASE